MIADIAITEKSFGAKSLYKNVSLSIRDGEKIGVIGRNGVGKSTLLGIISGEDKDFSGTLSLKKGIRIVSSRQEHHSVLTKSVLQYVLEDLPEYFELSRIIETYPEHMGDNVKKINRYSEALERFSQLDYYHVEEMIVENLKKLQLGEKAHRLLSELSGGQKRLVEVVKVMHSQAHLALVDEPTNHMDYAAKTSFIEWMKHASEAMLIITHDRDVLKAVDKIIEIKDGKSVIYNGNYDHYLRQNSFSTSNAMHEYEVVQRQITNLKDKVVQFRRLKEKSRDPDTIKQFKRREQQAASELAELEKVEKPSFWIDKTSMEGLGLKHTERYDKFKAKNIRLDTDSDAATHKRVLVNVDNLSLGYDAPLFSGVSFQLREACRVELRGRNGAGKTTLIRSILGNIPGYEKSPVELVCHEGVIETDSKVRVGVYEQEVSPELFKMTLAEAIEHVYLSRKLPITGTKIRQLMSDYLFEGSDAESPVARLSGGQKARLQLIAMFANSPNLLVLDEPTNHLDLPSIEELENALKAYHGAILYVSHDSYFQDAMEGDVVYIRGQDDR